MPSLTASPSSTVSLRAATLLTYLMPGLGHAYAGDIRRGAIVWLALCALFVTALAVWVSGPHAYVPRPTIWVLLYMAAGAAAAGSARDCAREAARDADTARPLYHPLALCGVWLGMGVFPICASIWYVEANHVGSVEVQGYAMFPQLLPGDRVFFDRKAFLSRRPDPGELVVVGDGTVDTIARVVAVRGARVSLSAGQPTVNGVVLTRYPVDELRVPRFQPAEQNRLSMRRGFMETNGGRAYLVVERRGNDFGADPPRAILAGDELYIIGDDRSAALQEGLAGRVRLGALRGRPEVIWSSRRSDGTERAGRSGLPIQ